MGKKHNIQDLLKTGDLLFRTNGYFNTGTDEILNAANYPRSSFYYHFKSKAGFGVKTLEYYGSNIQKHLHQFIDDAAEKSPSQRLKNYYKMVCTYVQDNKYASCCLVQRFSMDTGEEQNELQEAAYKELKQWMEIAKPCIVLGQEAGELRKDISADEISEFLFSSMYGNFTISRLSREKNNMINKLNLAFKLISV